MMAGKLRDHTSSKNVIVTPCITRMKKSHSHTAPSNDGTKFPWLTTVFKYLVKNPQRIMSTSHPREKRENARDAAAHQVELTQRHRARIRIHNITRLRASAARARSR